MCRTVISKQTRLNIGPALEIVGRVSRTTWWAQANGRSWCDESQDVGGYETFEKAVNFMESHSIVTQYKRALSVICLEILDGPDRRKIHCRELWLEQETSTSWFRAQNKENFAMPGEQAIYVFQ